MVLTTVPDVEAPEAARQLLARLRDTRESETSRAIMEMVTTIMVYKFAYLSRVKIETMLGLKLEETRVYQEAKEEGRQEGRQEGLEEGLQEGRQEEGRSLILRQLNRRLGDLPEHVRSRINTLSLAQLEALGEALLDFTDLTDLEAWLTDVE